MPGTVARKAISLIEYKGMNENLDQKKHKDQLKAITLLCEKADLPVYLILVDAQGEEINDKSRFKIEKLSKNGLEIEDCLINQKQLRMFQSVIRYNKKDQNERWKIQSK